MLDGLRYKGRGKVSGVLDPLDKMLVIGVDL